jgi:hypothetical protein
MGVDRDPLGRVRTTDVLLEWKNCVSDLENRDYGRGDSLRWPRDTLSPQKLALTSPTCGDGSEGIVRSRDQSMAFVCLFACLLVCLFVEEGVKDAMHSVRWEGFDDLTESWNIVTHVIQVTYSLQKACIETKRRRDIGRRLSLIRKDAVRNGVSWYP